MHWHFDILIIVCWAQVCEQNFDLEDRIISTIGLYVIFVCGNVSNYSI